MVNLVTTRTLSRRIVVHLLCIHFQYLLNVFLVVLFPCELVDDDSPQVFVTKSFALIYSNIFQSIFDEFFDLISLLPFIFCL